MMPTEWLPLLSSFFVVLARLGPLCAMASCGRLRVVTWRMRIITAILMTLVVMPSSGVVVPASYSPTTVASIMGREAVLGVVLAVALSAIGVSIELSGQLLGMLSGGAWGFAFGGGEESQTPLVRFLMLTTLVAFFCSGGHRVVLVATLDTYRHVPVGMAWTERDLTELVVLVLTQSVLFALRAAAPMILSLLVGAAIVGVATRLAPSFGQLSLNLGVNVLLLVASLTLGLGLVTRVYQKELEVVTGRFSMMTSDPVLDATNDPVTYRGVTK